MTVRQRPAILRLAARVVITETCWLWNGSTDAGGYGLFRAEGRVVRVHRWLYEQFVGPIPDGLQCDHLCRVRNCVRPSHIEPVTPQVNSQRSLRWPVPHVAKTHCDKGHAYDEANTRWNRRTGRRECRSCERERMARQRQRWGRSSGPLPSTRVRP